jgi:hypothetical protein
MSQSNAEIVREYGPFPGVDHVHGVTYDGQHAWFASGDKLNAFDPASGKKVRSIAPEQLQPCRLPVPSHPSCPCAAVRADPSTGWARWSVEKAV